MSLRYDELVNDLAHHLKECPCCEGGGYVYDKPGDTLWGMRQQAALSGKQMAQAMGISPQYLHDLERNRRPWSLKMMRRYLEILVEEGIKHGV